MSVVEQFNRVVRLYERFRELSHGKVHATESENYVDDVHAFFQNCYHLKDWIKNDPAAPSAMKGNVESYVSGSASLALCADLCNSQKHLVLNSTPRSGSIPSQAAKHVRLQVGGDSAILSMRIEIKSGSTLLDAFDIATDAVSDWATYLNQHGYAVQAPARTPRGSPVAPTTSAIAVKVTGHAATLRVSRRRSLRFVLLSMIGRTLVRLGNWLRA